LRAHPFLNGGRFEVFSPGGGMRYNLRAARGGIWDETMKRLLVLAFLLLPAIEAAAQGVTQAPTQVAVAEKPMSVADKKLADLIVKQCRDLYKHKRPCPCPYDTAKNDELCSTNSAYDKKATNSLFCERSDVKPEDIANYKNLNESFISARCTAK
jgi:hypothetical protein